MSPLESQKRLLVLESEINRVRFLAECRSTTGQLTEVTARVASVHTMALSLISLVGGLAALRNGKPALEKRNLSWFEKLAGAARLASTIWLFVRSRRSDSASTEAPAAKQISENGPPIARGYQRDAKEVLAGIFRAGEHTTEE